MPVSQPPTAFIIDAAKVRDYLLNPDHPVGRSKAVFFIECGFDAARSELLADCLFAHAASDRLVGSADTPFGTKWIFEGSIQTPAGVINRMRSVWIVKPNAAFAELVTAYRF